MIPRAKAILKETHLLSEGLEQCSQGSKTSREMPLPLATLFGSLYLQILSALTCVFLPLSWKHCHLHDEEGVTLAGKRPTQSHVDKKGRKVGLTPGSADCSPHALCCLHRAGGAFRDLLVQWSQHWQHKRATWRI